MARRLKKSRYKNDGNVAWSTTDNIVPAPSATEEPDRGLIDRSINFNSLAPQGRSPSSYRNFSSGRQQRGR